MDEIFHLYALPYPYLLPRFLLAGSLQFLQLDTVAVKHLGQLYPYHRAHPRARNGKKIE